jgi:hypothetical protein
MSTQKLTVIDPVAGFTERDSNSKAILNTDMNSLLKHKIQRRRFSEINRSAKELIHVKGEIDDIKTNLSEIKKLLLQITQKVE